MARLRGWGELGATAGLPARFLSDHVSFDFSPRRPTCQRPGDWGLARRRSDGEIVLVVPPLRHGRRLSRPINQDDHLGSTMSIRTAAKQSGDQDRRRVVVGRLDPYLPHSGRHRPLAFPPALPLVRVNHFHVRLVAGARIRQPHNMIGRCHSMNVGKNRPARAPRMPGGRSVAGCHRTRLRWLGKSAGRSRGGVHR